jgi:uncharacterized protein YjeT (DUF2065 family)
MKWFIYLFSILWIASGGIFILYTEQYRELMGKICGRMGRVPMAATAVVIGLLLVLSARGSLNTGVIVLIGILAIAKGVVFFLNPNGIFEKTLRWWLEDATDQTYRLTGIITLILGTALLSWA